MMNYLFIPYTYQSFIFRSSLSIRLVQNRGYQHFQSVFGHSLSLLSSWLTLSSLSLQTDWTKTASVSALNSAKDCWNPTPKNLWEASVSTLSNPFQCNDPINSSAVQSLNKYVFFLIIHNWLWVTAQAGVAHELSHVAQLFIETKCEICLFS